MRSHIRGLSTKLLRFGLGIVSVWSAAAADQNDPRLNGLFDRLSDTGNTIEAAVITREIWSIWQSVPDPSAQALLDRGMDDMARERFADALAAFDELVETAPGFAEGWNARATLYYMIGDYSSSAGDVKRTLQLEPRHFGALSGLGLIYLELNDLRAALAAFEAALAVNPHLSGARRNIEYIREQLSVMTL